MPSNQNTAAFTYYYDPVILPNKLTPLSIFERSSSEKVRFKIVYGLLLNRCSIGCKQTFKNDMDWNYIHFWDFLGDSVACVSFETKIQ